MANFGRGLRGAAAGAGLGLGLSATGIGAPLGIPLAAIGAVGGFFTGLFGESEEDIRRRRIGDLLRSIETNRTKRLEEGTTKIRDYTSGLRKGAEQRASRAALASGREGEAQALALPATGRVARAGAAAVEDFTTSTNQFYDALKYDVERDQASEPIEPTALDYAELLGQTGTQYAALKDIQSTEAGALKKEQERLGGFDNPVTGDVEMPEVVTPYQGEVYSPEQLDYLKEAPGRRILQSDAFGKLYNRNNYLMDDASSLRRGGRSRLLNP